VSSSVATRLPWAIKHRPRRLEDYVNQDEAKAVVVSWIREWLRGSIPNKKAILLYGPAGTGKTSLVEAVAGEFGLEVFEMNASDFRRKEDIERAALRASRTQSLTGKPKILLIDEIDGLSGTADKGGLDAILALIQETKHPVIMTANNPWHPNLRPLRESTMMVQVKRLKQKDTVEMLKRICEKERVYCEDRALKVIYEKNLGDLRSCINDLQVLAETYGRVTEELARTQIYFRDRELDPFETLRSIFTAKYAWQSKSAVTHSQLDYEMLIEWLNENIPLQLTELEDMYRAYGVLARADVYRGLIVKIGSWDLLSYVFDMLGPGIASSRKKTRFKWVAYKFPQRIKLLSETRQARENLLSAARKVAGATHVSSRKALSEYIPFIRAIYRLNKEEAILIMKVLDFSPQEASTVTGDPSVREIMEKKLTEIKAMVAVRAPSTTRKAHQRGSEPSSRKKERKRGAGAQKTLF